MGPLPSQSYNVRGPTVPRLKFRKKSEFFSPVQSETYGEGSGEYSCRYLRRELTSTVFAVDVVVVIVVVLLLSLRCRFIYSCSTDV